VIRELGSAVLAMETNAQQHCRPKASVHSITSVKTFHRSNNHSNGIQSLGKKVKDRVKLKV
jgi:hypothetical protein